MSVEPLVPFGTQLVQAWDAFFALPGAKPAVQTLAFLCGTSGAFWFLSSVLGKAALFIHDSLDHSLAVLFAVSYNLTLGVLFGAVMAAAVFHAAVGDALLVMYQAGAFVFVYLVLSATYSDAEGLVDEYALCGYLGGLAAFLLCCVRSQWLALPAVARAETTVLWVYRHWPGRLMTALSAVECGLVVSGKIRKKLFWKSVKIGERRLFWA